MNTNTNNTEKVCPYCKSLVSLSATKCPMCHSDLRSWFSRHKISSGILGIFTLVIFINIFSAVISGVGNSGTKMTEEMKVKEDAKNLSARESSKLVNARILAKEYIQRVPLKSPSTADYERPTIAQDKNNPNHYRAESYIDSQNGYGAMIRTYWNLTLEFKGNASSSQDFIDEGSNWKVIQFTFDGKKII